VGAFLGVLVGALVGGATGALLGLAEGLILYNFLYGCLQIFCA